MLEWWEQRQQLGRLARRYAAQLPEQVRLWTRLILQAARNTMDPDTALIASSIAYYTLISIFPLILLSVAIASRWFDPMWAESEIVTRLEFVAPALGDLLGQNMESIVRSRGPITGFALLILIWASSNIFNVLTRAMDKIWNARGARPVWKHRGIALLAALFISTLLLVASFAEGILVTIVNSLYPEWLQGLRPFTTRLWASFLSVLLFGVLYRLLPHRKLSWWDILPGAIAAGLVWELIKRAFLSFIDVYLSRSNLVYGSVTTIFVFLTWTYISSIIFLFGTYLNVAYMQWRRQASSVMGIK